jgi:DNA-binding NarL/FixJ family response regulator
MLLLLSSASGPAGATAQFVQVNVDSRRRRRNPGNPQTLRSIAGVRGDPESAIFPPVTGVSGVQSEIVGRDQELGRIGALLDDGGALLLEGEAGIGKTTVWRSALTEARERGLQVLAATPAQAEQSFAYGVLADLLAEVDEEALATLPPPQLRAIEQALRRVEAEAALEPFAVAIALHGVLKQLATGAPVVIAVDDVQWADGESAGLLAYAVRRSPSLRVLLAARSGWELPLNAAWERVPIGPLSPGALHHLVVQGLGLALPRQTLLRLHGVSGGNPFYALELARANVAGGPLVVPESLDDVVARRVGALPHETRWALAELALAGETGRADDLSAATDAGVIAISSDGPHFTHPLLAEAAVGLLAPSEVREVHAEVAAWTNDPDQRARHRALATACPDESVAAELEAAAESARWRSTLTSAELWEHAARLTPPDTPDVLARRGVEAGIATMTAGNGDRAIELLEANLPLVPASALRAFGDVHLTILLARKRLNLAVPRLTRLLDETDDIGVRAEIGSVLCTHLVYVGRAPEAAELAAGFVTDAEAASPAALACALANAAFCELTNDRPAWELIERLERVRRSDPEAPPSTSGARSTALLRDGRLEEARELTVRTRADPNAVPIWIYHRVVIRLALIELATGRREAAETLADEALILAEQMENPSFLGDALVVWAEAHALAGRLDDARRDGERALQLAVETGGLPRATEARLALGLIELSLGKPAEAAAHYREISNEMWRTWNFCVGGRAAIDAVEALVAAGDVELAREIADALPIDARERPAVESVLAATTGDPERAIELLRSSPPSPAPFRQARELLLLGRLLRRARHRNEARSALNDARQIFADLGAPLWVDRAQDEIDRLGGRTPAGNTLTESERRVAELVSAGLANKEVATALSVTVHTVEAHLSKIYAKLGIRSRTELAARHHSF